GLAIPTTPLILSARLQINSRSSYAHFPDDTGGSMLNRTAMRVVLGGLFVVGALAIASPQMLKCQLPNSYGAPISLEKAKKAAAPALAEAEKNHWNMAVAIVDISGNLVYYEKRDKTQPDSDNA